MPSIPQSLLWISLVVLWLFVLVPMLISKRDAVRRTSDVALATRVLDTGRSSRLRRNGPAAGHHSDPHWQPDEDELELDEPEPGPRRTIVLAPATAKAEPDYLDVDVVEEDSGALTLGTARIEEPELPLDFGPAEPVRKVAAAEALDEPEPEPELEAEAPEAEPEPAEEAEAEEAVVGAVAEDDGTDDEYEYEDDSEGFEAPAEDGLRDADAVAETRRPRYESKTAAAVSARKYRFRTRMLMSMTAAIVVSAIAAFLLTPTAWWVCGAIGAVTLLYLMYLRRQTRIEERLRRRRAQRMMRSRLGVENAEDEKFDVTPARLRRPGAAVLEIDDEDPIFEHLEYTTFARQYDLPRAAGQ